ncbi:MAG: sugar phosphate isomerase/epimerase [Candidatus Methanoperedens sp.]|nr:sugar phosphate isomerase/epimerase [Candidatus Methanoperedens sp.]
MIIGASSFASSLYDLGKEVASIELYIPKLELYKKGKVVKEKADELYDILSTVKNHTTIHAPYFGELSNYPIELMVDTAHMGRAQFRLMEESISLADELGSSVVVVHPGKITEDREKCFRHMVGNLRKLASKAGNCGIIIGLENKEGTDPTNLCCEARELLRAIKEVDSPFLKATFDIGHANLTCGGDTGKLRDFARELGDSVAHVHVHDNTGKNSEKYFGDLHGAPGEGCIDFTVLEELDCNAVYNLEVFSMEGVRTGKTMLKGLKQD